MANYTHLCNEQRDMIQHLLNQNYSFTYIANAIKVDRTTISKEVRRNRILKSSLYSYYSETGIKKAITSCTLLSRPPYVCNHCKRKSSCLLSKLYYNAKEAQKHYEETLKTSREGYDITKEEISVINKNIVPLIKYKKQSINQIYINHPDILTFSKPTFYKYVNDRVILLDNTHLPRKVRYKKRKKKNKKNKRDFAILKNRRYEDYLDRIEKNHKLHIWQLDTVIGKQTDKKVLMTFLLVETNFMIIRLLDKKTIEEVDKAFTKIKLDLGYDLYKLLIQVILTDNGTEFYDPIHLEYNLDTGEKLTSVYYCHPNSPNEKSELEKNHEYIRVVLPKKTSFNDLTEEQVKKLEDNINNIPREILGNISPYDLTKKMYPDLIKAFHSKHIKPDDVTLAKDDILN